MRRLLFLKTKIVEVRVLILAFLLCHKLIVTVGFTVATLSVLFLSQVYEGSFKSFELMKCWMLIVDLVFIVGAY
jgi:hypothetical protein